MKKKILILLGLLGATAFGAAAEKSRTVNLELRNTWARQQKDAPVVVRLSELNVDFAVRSATVKDGTQEIPSQLDDLDGDRTADELAFVIDMPAQSTRQIRITLSDSLPQKAYAPRVSAQLLIRDAKKGKHAPVQSVTVPGTTNFYNMVYGHGPMFESELVGYRIYFNEKQTIDPYGKFTPRLELTESRFYPTDEQLARGFGDDVLMVGNSCGIGTLKGWDGQKAVHIAPVATRTERILADGPVRAVVEVEVQGWEYQGSCLDMTQRYILYAGHRDLRIETSFSHPLAEEVFCTGVQNIMGNETVAYSDHRGLTGSWGRHWPVNDTVKYAKETIGIATCIPEKYIRQEVADGDNFLYTLSAPGERGFCHYTMFTSRKETFGFPDAEAWFGYMQEWKDGLEHPLETVILPDVETSGCPHP